MSVFKLPKYRRISLLVGVYLLLLLASTFARWARTEKPFPEAEKSVIAAAVGGDKLLENVSVRVAYREFTPPAETSRLPVIMIHGSPGDSSNLVELAKTLGETRRVIVPDLPGFGDSTAQIPDYSFRAHAFYVKQLADELKIEKFHALGFSMGGGVVLNLEQIAPERIASIEMVSAVGVQEYELLGDYYLNHVLHGAQFAAFWSLQNLVPHFGYFDGAFFGTSYAANFYDSDQRPLREILQKIEQPVLIVHGADDPLVPVEAAREHYRLVPQSEYRELADNHFMIFERPEMIAPVVEDFLMRSENGEAQTRKNADAGRLSAASVPFKREMIMADGSTALVFFLVLALATFVSEDLTSITAGALAGNGQISLALAIAACFFGIYIGDLLIFLAGRFFGRAAVSRAPLKWFVSETSLKRGAAWLGKNGMSAIFLSRITPGLRLPVYFSAGVLKTDFLSFAFFFAVAAAVWTPILVGATAWFSAGMMDVPMFTGRFWLGFLGLVASIFLVLNLLLRLATWRGRRMLVGTFKRLTEWEFWSLRTFYLPVVVYIAWLAIKFRSLSVFADANPAIEAGGFVGEPKAEIYECLRASRAAEHHLLRYVFIGAELENAAKLKIAETFLENNSPAFPVAFKPNAGERGAGVFIVKNSKELKSRIENSKTDMILQEFADGDEFGVFYYRYPNSGAGKIFAITEKRFPSVTGDGKANLEKLILRDRRAVALANAYFERNAERLGNIPANGEKIALIDIGTHSKGAIFLDGGWIKTFELERKIDEICRGYQGFYFGRFDLRTSSIEDFKRGENFKIIELNGVTSEATSIYDPKNSLFNAYRILFKQWKIAFEIGSQNRANGTKPTTILDLTKLLYENWFGKSRKQSKIQSPKSKVQNPKSKIEDVSDFFRP
jgi:pimeloyl-ACP methyl ester carboxylesterase/membrane protein DedA with SNARE-associated domain